MVVTYRSEPRWAEGLVETLGDLGRLQPLDRIELLGLCQDEVRTFLAAATGVLPSVADAAAAHRRTNGNPFFLAEVARLMASEGPMARVVPSGIREVIGRRLARLPDQTRALLLVAAVVGQLFDLPVVAQASEASLDHALDFIDPAVITGIVAEDEERPGRYRFAHALVQETVYGGASGLRRSRLHGKVGEAIEGLGRPASRLPELAYHFAEAAAATGAERGISYSLMAAAAAQEGPAPEAAEDHLRRALALLETLPEGPDRDLRELVIQDRLATLLSTVRGITAPGAKQVWDRAFELCRRNGDPRLLLRSLWGVFGDAIAHARLQDAGQVARQMLQLGETCDDVTAAVAGHVAAGGVAFHTGDFAMADAQFARALEMAEERPEPGLADTLFLDLPATAGVYLGMVRQVQGHKGDGALSHAAVERARAEGGPFALCFVLHVDAFAHIFAGDLEGLRQRADEMLDVAERNNFGDFRSEALLFRGWATACDGDPDAGLAAVVGGVNALRGIGLRLQGTLYAGLLADCQRLAGRLTRRPPPSSRGSPRWRRRESGSTRPSCTACGGRSSATGSKPRPSWLWRRCSRRPRWPSRRVRVCSATGRRR